MIEFYDPSKESRRLIGDPPRDGDDGWCAALHHPVSCNEFARRMLTDQGACVHVHHEERVEDHGGCESGPMIDFTPAYDEYSGDSHYLIIDAEGHLAHQELIDWKAEAFYAAMTGTFDEQAMWPLEPFPKDYSL